MALRVRHHIDTYKTFAALYMIGATIYFRQWDNVAVLASTLATSSYCFMWVVKSNLFPDANWEKEIKFELALMVIWTPLLLYLVGPTLMMVRGATLPPWVAFLFLFMFVWGVFLHYVGDSHKYFILKARPGLVCDGVWRISRNVNYLGELFIYSTFAGIPAATLRSPWPLAPLCWSIFFVWIPNMLRKDKSISRYPEFAAWKKRTAFWIPFLW